MGRLPALRSKISACDTRPRWGPQGPGQSAVGTGEHAGGGVVLRVGPVVVRQTWPEFALGLVAVATGAGGREQRLPFLDRGGVLVVGVFAGLLECLDGSRLGL